MSKMGSKGEIGQYEIQGEIGRGASGTCYKAIHVGTRKVYAIKKITVSTLKVHED